MSKNKNPKVKTVEDLRKGDVIAFEDPTEGIVVEKIDEILNGRFIVYYLYSGHKSTSADVEPKDVLAIGDPNGNGKIANWTGRFNILQPEKIKAILEAGKEARKS